MSESALRTGRWRTPAARVLTVVGVLLVVVSIAANFVERQVLDTGEFKETARQLVVDPAIQDQVASNLTDQLFTSVDIQGELARVLPEEQEGLAGAITGALRPVAERLAGEILDRPRFQEVWVTALGAAQQQVVKVLDDKARFLETSQGVVVVDLRPLLVELSKELPVVPDLESKLPPDTGVIRLFEAEQLDTAQKATRLLRFVADWIWVLALAAWVAAIWIARDRRKEVRAIALGFVVVGLILLVVRRVAGRYLVDQLSTSASDENAVRQTWDILTRLLADAAWAAVGLGVIALVGVWLFGPARRGTIVRGWLAPYLRRPELAFGGAAFVYLLLLLWGPISYVRKPTTVLVFAVLAALGVEALRRKAARDFPDAQPGEPLAALRGRAERLRGAPAATTQADELERLAGLKERGMLTDEEFAAAKARLLG
ncbi:MAG TPA: SHOCT domain-containing protein [Gaiella sp.]